MMPVLAMAKASPRMPLPMMALLRLNTDTPNDVFPSNCGHRREMGDVSRSGGRLGAPPSCPPEQLTAAPELPTAPRARSAALAHIREVWLLAGAFL